MAYIDTLIYCLAGGFISGIIPVAIIYPFVIVKKHASYVADLRD